jgi:hypothetical protein
MKQVSGVESHAAAASLAPRESGAMASATMSSAHSIRRTAAEILGTRSLDLESLMVELEQHGRILGAEPAGRVITALEADTRFYSLDDDRWALLAALLDGTEWSTVLPAQLPEDDGIVAEPDLSLIAWWALSSDRELVAPVHGTVASVELDDGMDALEGPPGWLPAQPGEVMAVAMTADTVAARRLDEVPAVSTELAAAVHRAFDEHAAIEVLEDDLGVDAPVDLVHMPLQDLLVRALLRDRHAFRQGPIPPVDMILEAASLSRRYDEVGYDDMDWEALDRLRRRESLASTYRLEPDQLDAAELVIGGSLAVLSDDPYEFGTSDGERDAALVMGYCLSDPPVCRAFIGRHSELGTPPEDLERFARWILQRVDAERAAGAGWLLARALDHQGDTVGALEAAESAAAHSDHPLALRALAAFRSDQGDAAGALTLLRRAGVEDDDLLDEVEFFAHQRPRPSTGRNDPCPCGSGRKYKACHLGQERVALAERAPWLYAKARRYLHDGWQRVLGAELARVIADESERDVFFMLELMESEIVDDLALCECGVFEDFMHGRDGLLPDDEAMLAARWSLVSRSLFEIDRIDGDRLGLRDLRTGDRIVVTNVTPSATTRPGALLLGRPLPVGDTFRAFSGFVHIGGALRDEVLHALDEADPFVLAALIGAAWAPPEIQNTDGEPTVFHELVYRLPDPEHAVRVLREHDGLDERSDGTFVLVRDTANQPSTVIMSLEPDGDTLRITVNSDRRAEEARAFVAQNLPDAVLEDDEVIHLSEFVERRDRGDADDALDLTDPATDELLDTLIRQHEERWLDEPVPALRGLTPREAADDPIGGEELDRLLRTFGPPMRGGFDAARLREALGLS